MSAGGFGFQVPQGDPGALESASTSWRLLAAALDNQGQAIASAAQVALGAGGWQGPASAAFAGSSERLMGALSADVEACGQAAGALSRLSQALERAQQAARQALAECEQAQGEANTQTEAAARAGQAASSARQAAASAVHPGVVAALSREATAAEQQQGAAQNAAGQAQDALAAAELRGQQAVLAYEHEATAVSAALRSAGSELQRTPELGHGWADAIITWAGHANDFAGAGAVGLAKGYDQMLALAAGKLQNETEAVLDDPAATGAIMNGLPVSPYDDAPDPVFDMTAGARSAAESPLTKLLSQGLSEDDYPILGKVPFLAAGLTLADMFENRDEGVSKAVVQPVGNLAVGTAITEAAAPAVSEGVTSVAASLAAGDGAIAALAGTAIVPGVGEVVIVGGIAVLGTIAVDQGVTWVWNHGGAHVADAAWHGIEHGADWAYDKAKPLVHTAEHVVHDLEPWNW